MKGIKAILKIVMIIIFAFGAIYLLNKGTLDKAARPIKEVTGTNYTEAIKNQIQIDDTVQITGTPDLLNQVSQESLTPGSSTERRIEYYYVSLKEYGFDFVVRISPGKLIAKEQVFTGKAIGLAQSDFGTRIKNSLNKPLNFDESVNALASAELDDISKEQLSKKSEANFTNSTLLIMDEEVTEFSSIFGSIIFWTGVLTLFLIALLKKQVFSN